MGKRERGVVDVGPCERDENFWSETSSQDSEKHRRYESTGFGDRRRAAFHDKIEGAAGGDDLASEGDALSPMTKTSPTSTAVHRSRGFGDGRLGAVGDGRGTTLADLKAGAFGDGRGGVGASDGASQG